MNELSFKLSAPISISKGGDFEDVYELVLTAPTMKDRKQAGKLKQFIARAQAKQERELFTLIGLDKIEEIRDKAQEGGEIEVGGDEVRGLKELIEASDEDLDEFYTAFETLMLRVCTVDVDTPIKTPHIEMLDLKDFENLCFEYCENFIK